MNAVHSPTRKKKHRRYPIKPSPPTELHKRSRLTFSPITIPGTPENQSSTVTYSTKALTLTANTVDSPYRNESNEQADVGMVEEITDIDLYYKIFNRYKKPDVDESNAESAARHQAISTEYRRLKQNNNINNKNNTATKTFKEHTLTPLTQYGNDLQFNTRHTLSPLSLAKHNNVEPIIEPISPLRTPEETIVTIVNNVQEINIHTDHSLYANPDRPVAPQSIDLIYDTGAALSMMPAQYSYAWRNLRPCLHTLAVPSVTHKAISLTR
jgi:hypothetical protein